MFSRIEFGWKFSQNFINVIYVWKYRKINYKAYSQNGNFCYLLVIKMEKWLFEKFKFYVEFYWIFRGNYVISIESQRFYGKIVLTFLKTTFLVRFTSRIFTENVDSNFRSLQFYRWSLRAHFENKISSETPSKTVNPTLIYFLKDNNGNAIHLNCIQQKPTTKNVYFCSKTKNSRRLFFFHPK